MKNISMRFFGDKSYLIIEATLLMINKKTLIKYKIKNSLKKKLF